NEEKSEAKKEKVVKEAGKKKEDKKRKASGIRIDEGKSKKRHDKKARLSDSGTESDERTLAQRMKHMSAEDTFKEMHRRLSK
ncbi:hypothetical protein A2U01_0067992, partial [Trifolium medium]|nr:hypothetical protein [Trifolium medium]